MQMYSHVLMLFVLCAFTPASSDQTANPIQKIIAMISDIEKKTIEEGKVAQTEYETYSEWCEDTSKNLEYEVKTGKLTKEDLEATIEKMTANIEASDTEIERLAAEVASLQSDLDKATKVRETDHDEFIASKKEDKEVISALDRSEADLEKKIEQGGASMLQAKRVNGVTQALNIMVESTNTSLVDASKFMNLLQSDDSDEDMELGAPAAEAYADHSSVTLETLEKLEEKAKLLAQDHLKKEEKEQYDFNLVKESLEQDIHLAEQELQSYKDRKAEDSQSKATAEGDLSVTKADLANDVKALEELHSECMTHANDFEVATQGRAEELKALATAKKIITEATGGAQKISYGLEQVSFVQLKTSVRLSTSSDAFEVVQHVRDLAHKQKSRMLAQLASRLSTAVKLGTSESDVFAKIKGMVTDMIAKLEDEADSDATEKAYCDKETSETTEKKSSNAAEIKKLSTKLDQAKLHSTKLKTEVAALQEELAELAKSQATMDKMRSDEKATFTKNEAELKQGISGVQLALKVLNDYYSKADARSGTGGNGIIALLETAESDMSKDLSEISTIEKTALSTYTEQTTENELTRTAKTQDEKYKSKEFTSLDHAVEGLSSDLDGVETEQDAVLAYLGKINERCIAKPDPYEERKARREAEMAGLKDALDILEDETALIQKASKRTLRAMRPHQRQ